MYLTWIEHFSVKFIQIKNGDAIHVQSLCEMWKSGKQTNFMGDKSLFNKNALKCVIKNNWDEMKQASTLHHKPNILNLNTSLKWKYFWNFSSLRPLSTGKGRACSIMIWSEKLVLTLKTRDFSFIHLCVFRRYFLIFCTFTANHTDMHPLLKSNPTPHPPI